MLEFETKIFLADDSLLLMTLYFCLKGAQFKKFHFSMLTSEANKGLFFRHFRYFNYLFEAIISIKTTDFH